MAEWIDAQPTMEFRWLRYADSEGFGDILQQKWKVARGGAGRGVEYTEEWRDVPTVKE